MAKQSKASRKQVIADIKSLSKRFPNTTITRDFYRQHSEYSEIAHRRHFASHADLISAAGLEPLEVKIEPQAVTPAEKLAHEQAKLAAKNDDKQKLLNEALKKLEIVENEKNAILDLTQRTPQITEIAPKTSSNTSESVAFVIASDWHSEEEVLPGQVGGLNKHNLEIGADRATRFWQGAHRLYDIFRRDTTIKTIVVGLLGDFITGSIHDDLVEGNLLAPGDAVYRVQNMLLSGLRFLLANTDADLLVVCHGGNHGRTTKEQRIASETGNSFEQYLYYNLRDLLANEPRVKFQIAEGYHSYVRLFDGKYTVRMHHGHGMNYGGGVGGMYVPVNKAIGQWNKGNKVDLDVFGHFHTYIDAGNFVANGSMIGYNAYAVRIKADYEKPTQSFFLVNRKYNSKTICTPIFV